MFKNEIFQLICSCLNTIVLVVGVVLTLVLCFEYRRNHSRILLSYIPNIWTSLGILGTFMAIGNSLTNSVAIKNVDNASIGVLIEEIIPAFETSVIGIVGAIVASIIIKWHYSSYDKKENELYVNSVGDNIPPELLLNNIHHSLERLIIVIQLQESNIKSFLDNYMLQLTEFYNRIFESNNEQVKTLSDKYVNNVSSILASTNKEINKRIETLLLSHSQSIQEYLKSEETKLSEVANDIRNFLKGVPQSVDSMKNGLIECLRSTIIEKYNQLLDSNNALIVQMLNDSRKLTMQLLQDSKVLCKELYESNEVYSGKLYERVITFESELIQNTEQQCSNTLETARIEIQKIIVLLEESLSAHSLFIKQMSTTLNGDMSDIVSSVTKSSKDHKAIVDQLNRLLPILETQISHSEQNITATKQSEANLRSIIENLEEIAKKNQQLRYELMQWKRVHKKVKINDKNGTKECPNCGAENPMDANFCRKCTCGFWDCETNI